MRGRLVALGLLTVGLSLALPATRAHADYQILTDLNDPENQSSYNSNLVIASTQTDWGPGTSSNGTLISDPFEIQQFNPANFTEVINGKTQEATLYEVVVSLKYVFENTIQMSFVNNSTSTVTAQGTMKLDVANSAGALVIQNIVNPPSFSNQATVTFPTDFAPGQVGSYTPAPKVVASTSAMGYYDASTLSAFTGPGMVSLPVYATATSSYMNSSGNGAGGSRTNASAALSVTYYYYFVPEPSSLVLTSLGGLGLCVVSRVRSRRKNHATA